MFFFKGEVLPLILLSLKFKTDPLPRFLVVGGLVRVN